MEQKTTPCSVFQASHLEEPKPPPLFGPGSAVVLQDLDSNALFATDIGYVLGASEKKESRTSDIRDPSQVSSEKDRANWKVRALGEDKDLQNILQRIDPIERAISVSTVIPRAAIRKKTGVRGGVAQPPYAVYFSSSAGSQMSGRDLGRLLMQHLEWEGHTQTRRMLEMESGVDFVEFPDRESRLQHLVTLALHSSDVLGSMAASPAVDASARLNAELTRLGLVSGEDDAGADDGPTLWDEPEDSPDNILFQADEGEQLIGAELSEGGEDGDEHDASVERVMPESIMAGRPIKDPNKILAASLNKLVCHLTPARGFGGFADLSFMKTFLMTYRLFCEPAELFYKLVERYHVPESKQGDSGDTFRITVVLPIQLRVVNVLKSWVHKHFDDFDEQLLRQFEGFVDEVLAKDHVRLAKQIRFELGRKLSGHGRAIHRHHSQVAPPPIVPGNLFDPNLSLLDVSPDEIARQLTLIQFDLFESIKPSELMNQAWLKPKLRHTAPNVIAVSQHFNDVAEWVSTTVVRPRTVMERAKYFRYFIDLAIALRRLNNFDTLNAVLAGLNAAPVHRLKHTKNEVTRVDKLNELNVLLRGDSNYKAYRAALRNSTPPCIPYLGTCLTDLTFIEEGNPTFLKNLVNFAKCQMLYTVVMEIQQLQQRPYSFQPIAQLDSFINRQERWDSATLDKASRDREPPNCQRADIA